MRGLAATLWWKIRRGHGHRDVTALPSKADLPRLIAAAARPAISSSLPWRGRYPPASAYALPDQLDAELAKAKGTAA
ncbi:MAG: hypothetical protein R3D66_01705 [Alphaproteobacteria bacterium]